MASRGTLATLLVDVVVNTRRAQLQIKRIGEGLEEGASKSKKFGASVATLGLAAIVLLTLKRAFNAVIGSIIEAVNAAAKLEKAFLDVQKTAGFSTKELRGFKQEIITLSTNIRGLNVAELQKAAIVAGQMGIAGKDIAFFSEQASIAARALSGLDIESASTQMGQLLTVFGEAPSAIVSATSALNALENSTVATADQVLNISVRAAGLTRTLGGTIPQLFAVATTMRQAGVRSEIAGSVITKVLTKIITDSGQVAKFLGLTVNQLQQLINNKGIVGVFGALLEQLNKVGASNAAEFLQSIGVAGSRTAPAIFSMSNAIDQLNKNLETSQTNFDKGNSQIKQFNLFTDSLEVSISELKNQWELFKGSIGDSQVFKDLIDDLTALLAVLRNIKNSNVAKSLFKGSIADTVTQIVENTNSAIGLLDGIDINKENKRARKLERLRQKLAADAARKNNVVSPPDITQKDKKEEAIKLEKFNKKVKELNRQIRDLKISLIGDKVKQAFEKMKASIDDFANSMDKSVKSTNEGKVALNEFTKLRRQEFELEKQKIEEKQRLQKQRQKDQIEQARRDKLSFENDQREALRSLVIGTETNKKLKQQFQFEQETLNKAKSLRNLGISNNLIKKFVQFRDTQQLNIGKTSPQFKGLNQVFKDAVIKANDPQKQNLKVLRDINKNIRDLIDVEVKKQNLGNLIPR